MAKRGEAKSKKNKTGAGHPTKATRQDKEKGSTELKAKHPQSMPPRAKEKADELARIWDEDLCE
ncbi:MULTISPECIES: hypothetical protein [unclassified Nitrospina]|uniref:hypothetical protein n=1 Tax=unclassified Nitrospina TaxID=2638683 RepID=UPI003F9990F6